jgi:hypothetical protein
MRLTRAKADAFESDGYVLDNGFLNESELAHLLDGYMETVTWLLGEGALEKVQSGDDRDDDYQVYQIRTAHLQHLTLSNAGPRYAIAQYGGDTDWPRYSPVRRPRLILIFGSLEMLCSRLIVA